MQSYTRYLNGKKFETIVGRHRIVTDQPVSGGGTDAGPSPPELLLTSLGACAGHYAAEYLNTRSLPAATWKFAFLRQKALALRALPHFGLR